MATDRLVAQILEHAPALEGQLRSAGVEEGDLPQVMQLLREMPPLGLVGLLGKGRAQAGASPSGVTGDMDQGIERLVEEVAARHGFRPEHARQALQLLRDGTVEKDLAGVAADTSRAVGQLPGAIADTVGSTLTNPFRAFRFAFAVARDLAELPSEGSGLGRREFERLLRGGKGSPGREFPLFDHTLRVFYEDATVEVLKDWTLAVTEHESVQLAMILFAASQGVNLEAADIQAARSALGEGNLTPAIVAGVSYFQREHGDRFPEILGVLA